MTAYYRGVIFLSDSVYRNQTFWIGIMLVIITLILMSLIYTDLLSFHITISGFFIHHWFSWAGTLFISFFTPAYVYYKRTKPLKLKNLLRAHVFGNLLALMLISIHFTHQISRPAQFYPDLGTGIVLYISVVLMALTGFMLRFKFLKSAGKTTRFLHSSTAIAFYLIILVHILHGLGII